MWDLRTPSGIFFGAIGAILCVQGFLNPDLRAPLATANVNLAAGVPILIFGGVLLWLSKGRKS